MSTHSAQVTLPEVEQGPPQGSRSFPDNSLHLAVCNPQRGPWGRQGGSVLIAACHQHRRLPELRGASPPHLSELRTAQLSEALLPQLSRSL